jgi:hypothetical protein
MIILMNLLIVVNKDDHRNNVNHFAIKLQRDNNQHKYLWGKKTDKEILT